MSQKVEQTTFNTTFNTTEFCESSEVDRALATRATEDSGRIATEAAAPTRYQYGNDMRLPDNPVIILADQ